MIKPMLAEPFTKAAKRGVIGDWSHFALEQKYDGIRLVVYRDAFDAVDAFTRPRDNGTRFISQRDKLSPRLLKELGRLPSGYIVDGELLNGDVSTDVKRRDILDQQSFVVFDLLDIGAHSAMGFTYDQRRAGLVEVFEKLRFDPSLVRLAPSTVLKDEAHFKKLRDAIWRSGKEGVVLKRRSSVYHAGKRTLDWIKVKKVEHDALPVIGYAPTRGEVSNRGPFGIVLLRGDHADPKTWPSCKIRNDEEFERIVAEFERRYPMRAGRVISLAQRVAEQSKLHGFKWPFEERNLVIEHFGRTRDGGYRGPVLFDRWEDE